MTSKDEDEKEIHAEYEALIKKAESLELAALLGGEYDQSNAILSINAGAGGTFGGSDGSGIQYTRRGVEKVLFNATITVAILFVLAAFTALFF